MQLPPPTTQMLRWSQYFYFFFWKIRLVKKIDLFDTGSSLVSKKEHCHNAKWLAVLGDPVSSGNILSWHNIDCKLNLIIVYFCLLNQRQVNYLKLSSCHSWSVYLLSIYFTYFSLNNFLSMISKYSMHQHFTKSVCYQNNLQNAKWPGNNLPSQFDSNKWYMTLDQGLKPNLENTVNT